MATASTHKVTLNLTAEEAQTLATLLYCHVAGDSRPRRVLTDHILGALETAGFFGMPSGFRTSNGTRSSVVVIDR